MFGPKCLVVSKTPIFLFFNPNSISWIEVRWEYQIIVTQGISCTTLAPNSGVNLTMGTTLIDDNRGRLGAWKDFIKTHKLAKRKKTHHVILIP